MATKLSFSLSDFYSDKNVEFLRIALLKTYQFFVVENMILAKIVKQHVGD